MEEVIVLSQYLDHREAIIEPDTTIYLTAEKRLKSRQRLTTPHGECFYLHLPRGTVLAAGDYLTNNNADIIVKIAPEPEPVMTVTATVPLLLLKAAYHLGNRHIPLEITPSYLRFTPDPVLANMLTTMGLEVREEITPFYPEIGAYYHSHA